MRDITDRQLAAFRRFLTELVRSSDKELLLLKGHLLIEEQVRELIDRRVRNPEALRAPNARLECHQAIQLAQAFFPPGHLPETWSAIARLNKMRNDIAHNIIPKGSLSDRIDAWVQSFPSGFRDYPDKSLRFEFTLWSLFDSISELVDSPVAEVRTIDGNGAQ